MNPFSLKAKIGANFGAIYLINSWFNVNNKFDKRIECYDINGHMVDSKNLENVYYDKNEQAYFSFGYFNSKFYRQFNY